MFRDKMIQYLIYNLSRCGNFPMALDALNSGAINPDKYLTKVYSLEEVEAAIKHAATKGTLKIQLDMQKQKT